MTFCFVWKLIRVLKKRILSHKNTHTHTHTCGFLLFYWIQELMMIIFSFLRKFDVLYNEWRRERGRGRGRGVNDVILSLLNHNNNLCEFVWLWKVHSLSMFSFFLSFYPDLEKWREKKSNIGALNWNH